MPADGIVGLDAGELFVRRNVANLAAPSDLDFLAVLAFRIDALCALDVCARTRARMRDVACTIIVRDAWRKLQELAIDGWI